jgi:hypothetical protein
MKVALNPDELFNLNPIIDEEYVIDIVAQHNAMTDNNELYPLTVQRFLKSSFPVIRIAVKT